MNIHILAGGPSDLIPAIENDQAENVLWVGVDRGVLRLLRKGMTPVQAFGDFDSVSSEELEWMKQQALAMSFFSEEKDETDMGIAVDWAIAQNPTKIKLFGATGGRLDHLFGNIQLLIRGLSKNVCIEIIDKYNIIFLLNPGQHEVMHNQEFPYISFVPISSQIEDLTLKGFKYELNNCHIPQGSTLCISNEISSQKGTFSFRTGILMVIRSKDISTVK